jgi:hypothetical protein
VKVGLVQACRDPRLFDFKLWPRQQELLVSVERGPRIQVWALGRRSGKTTLAALVALGDCLFRPDLDALVRPGERRHAVAVATNIRQARLFVHAALSVVERSPLLAEMVEGVTEDEILFSTGAALSAFPCTSRGRSSDRPGGRSGDGWRGRRRGYEPGDQRVDEAERRPRATEEELAAGGLSEERNPERDATFLAQLETRRAELAVAQWQAPGLTIAAQAFLLTVITNTAIPPTARAYVLAAGVVATFAAGMSLLRAHEREVRYSEASGSTAASLVSMISSA